MTHDLPGFETFTKRMVPLGKAPFVTIQKRGLLSFNKAAFYAMGRPQAVELLFNKADRVIAVRPVDEAVPHAYRFRGAHGREREPTTYLLAATAFTNYYEIPTEVSIRRSVTVRDGVIFIDLKEEGTEIVGNRGKQRLGTAG